MAASGDAIAGRLGCAGCHAGMPPIERPAPAISPGAFTAERIIDALDGTATGMPDFHLDSSESLALGLFLAEPSAERALRNRYSGAGAVDAAAGARIYDALNCAGCHVTPGFVGRAVAPSLGIEGSRVGFEWLRSYLREPTAIRLSGAVPGSGSRMPRFEIDGEDADSLAVWLGRSTAELPAWRPADVSAFAAAKQRALMTTRYSCTGCHAMAGDGGRLAPDFAVSAERLRPAYLRAMLTSPAHLVPGTIMPPAPATDAALDGLASWLVTLEGPRAVDTIRAGYLSLIDNALIAVQDDGADPYARLCSGCHGNDGSGRGFNARYLRVSPANHADAEAMSSRTDDRLYDAIAAGARFLDGSPQMPGFRGVLDDATIRSIVAHIRSLCRCEAPAWSRDGGKP